MHAWAPPGINLLVVDTATVFAAGLLFALLARRLRQSLLLGYLVAGLVIGPHALALVRDQANIRFLAEVGVVLLMFALGAQLSLRQFLEVRGAALGIGVVQGLVLVLLGVLFGRTLGLSLAAGLVLGYALALNSSVMLVRLLSDIDGTQTQYGRLALGISLVLDLLAVVMMSTLPFLQRSVAVSTSVLGIDVGKALLFVLWVLALARWVAPFLLKRASSSGSREIFLLTVVVLSLGNAILSGMLGFSFALGAFLAGLVISDSIFGLAVLAEIIPLRDIFGLLFFISLGMLVDPAVILHHPGLVLALLSMAMLVKGAVLFFLLLAFRAHPFTAIMTSVSLAQIGEFSFIIAGEARGFAIISPAWNSLILSVAILSIAATPLLLLATSALYRHWRLTSGRAAPAEAMARVDPCALAEDKLAPVLLCGYGRVGRTIAQALDTFRVPFTVIDIDQRAVRALRQRAIDAHYGDATSPRLLERMGVAQYRLGVIAVTGGDAVNLIAMHLRRLNPGIRLLLRSHTDRETAYYLAHGVEGVVHVELEASLAFVREVLTTANVDDEIVTAYLEDIRLGYYEGLMPFTREE